ncbi:uncharacterized [Tachysurus ichikawai]
MNHAIHHEAGPPAHSGTEGEAKGKREGLYVRETRLQMVKRAKSLNLRQSRESEDDCACSHCTPHGAGQLRGMLPGHLEECSA